MEKVITKKPNILVVLTCQDTQLNLLIYSFPGHLAGSEEHASLDLGVEFEPRDGRREDLNK